MDDVAFASASEQAELLRRKEVSPGELVDTYLARIDKLDPTINAYVTVDAERALDSARRATQEVASGNELPPFCGVPIAVKDLTATAGLRTTYGCRAFADHVPDQDAVVVARLRSSGFIVLGKTNTSELGSLPFTECELNGDTHNPWDPERTPGGSSGGAAAAVAAGMAPVAQGTDAGGSIRIPASCCGLFGIKPARGRVSHAPDHAESWSGHSTSGPIARTVTDAAALLDVMAGYETGDPYWAPSPERPFADEVGRDPGRLRVAFTAGTVSGVEADPEVVAGLDDAARLLSALGHDVHEAAPEWADPELLINVLHLTWFVLVSYYGVTDFSLLEPLNRHFSEIGKSTSAQDYVRVRDAVGRWARRVVAFWDDYDLLLTPTVALLPPPIGWVFEPDDPWQQAARSGSFIPYTQLANVTGQPAVSLPLHWSQGGLPVGVQVVGRPGGEATLIRVSSQLEAARPWGDRRPPVA